MVTEEPEVSTGTEVALPQRTGNRRKREQEVQRHPLVRKASELFDTEIVTILDLPKDEEGGEPAGEGPIAMT